MRTPKYKEVAAFHLNDSRTSQQPGALFGLRVILCHPETRHANERQFNLVFRRIVSDVSGMPSVGYLNNVFRAVFAIVFTLSSISCARRPDISEYPPLIDLPHDYSLNGVPVITVGRVLQLSPVGAPRISTWGGAAMFQMYRAKVAVENMLHGDMRQPEIEFFYFVPTGSWDGPPRLGNWHTGDREMFFLQWNSGVLRTVCDTYEHCVLPVFTGAHAGWRPSPNDKSIGDRVVDFLLTRGEGCTDEQLIKQIGKTPSFDINNSSAIQKLQEVALNERGNVRNEACQALASFGDSYFRMSPDPSLPQLREACGGVLKETPWDRRTRP